MGILRRGHHEIARSRSENRPVPYGRYVAAVFVASATLFYAPLSATASSGSPQKAAVSAGTSSPCPGGGSQCVSQTIPIQCGASTCPATVTAGPTTNVGGGEYVYLSMSGFPTTDWVRIAYCPTTSPPTIVSGGDPMCAFGIDEAGETLTSEALPVNAQGDVQASFGTEVDQSGEGNTAIPASPIISDTDPRTPFYCDNGPDYCALEVEDLPYGDAGTPETASNTAIFPLTFQSADSGCPSSDPQVFTDSAFSVEHFLPVAVDATCAQSAGVAAVNTATETGQVVQNFASGGVAIAFTDEPQDPSEQTTLQGVKYRYIPISVSATVVGFLGGDFVSVSDPAAPIATYNLTPNMVAGLITLNYPSPLGSDDLMPPLECKEIYECQSGESAVYNSFSLLNPVPAGTAGPQVFGSYFSSTESGASYQTTNWLCSSPNDPVTVTVPLREGNSGVPTPVQVTDTHVASATLTHASQFNPVWPPSNLPPGAKLPHWPYPTCQPYATLPVLAAQVTGYSFAETPALQAAALRGFTSQGVVADHTLAAFGAMDWSEASYFGLNAANLQNASGAFVPPSAASIDAALSDATQAPDGVLQYNYDNTSDAAAYPMPLVTYALVSTASQPAADTQAEGDLLTNLVCFSHAGTGLPSGYVPMPDDLYTQAISEIDQTLPYSEQGCNGKNPALPTSGSTGKKGSGPTGTSGTGTSSTSTSTTTSAGQPTSTTTSGTTTPRVVVTTGNQTPLGSHSSTSPHNSVHSGTSTSPTPPARSGGASPVKSFEPVILALAEGTERWIVAGLGGAALLGLIAGPLVVLAPRARRKLTKRRARTKVPDHATA
jgi:hypothetical protein